MKIKIITITFFISVCGLLLNAQERDGLDKYKMDNEQLAYHPEVVFMGNSITEFWSIESPAFFQGKQWTNRGISGQTTPQMLVRFRQDVIALQPKVVVILAGTNDIAGNTGPTSIPAIADNIFSMCQLAKANNIRVILCSLLPAGDYPWKPGLFPAPKIIELNQKLKSFAEANQMIYLDYHSTMSDQNGAMLQHLADDGVHPNKIGYAHMEQLLQPVLEAALLK